MIRQLSLVVLTALFSGMAFGQESVIRRPTLEDLPKFEVADVRVSAKVPNPFPRTFPVRGGRYEIKNATIVDLIRTAYGFDADKVLGGPNWLEMDRFDILAKVPEDSTPETQKLMLQSLLVERFKLVTHKETKALPTYALIVGKKLQIKEADGKGDTGCRIQPATGAPPEGGTRLMMMASGSGAPTTINLGPGGTITYLCRNITMADFAGGLRGMMGASVGPNQVLDETQLKGAWSFDVKWSMGLIGPMLNASDRISTAEALEKQLGLKLEEKQIPTPVIVVDSVNQKPSDNPPGVSEALPVIPFPTEFEVADLKPAEPGSMMMRFQVQPGGKLMVQGMPLRLLISRALGVNNNDQVVGVPKFADTDRYDITAKAPALGPSAPALDQDSVGPMVRALLVERFKMTYHTEERPVSAYSLVAAKPKMKKADPASRTSCKNPQAPPGAPPGTRMMVCQNITMAQFADRLLNMGPGMNSPILDATGLEGGWDFTLSFSFNAMMNMAPRPGGGGGGIAGGGGGDAGPAGAMPAASEPISGLTLFEALEKQLGLKPETQKRPLQVFVIDHLEQKPTEN